MQCTVHNEKYLTIKIKSYGNIKANFHDKGMSKECSHFILLSAISIDSDFKLGKNCCLEVFLVECKNIIKEKINNDFLFLMKFF